ncbi:conserved hypothetical protein [Deferribacter desulfuricans SSM1]|uniref:Putative manganese efflux pump MntP n=1 Tax=Deferribacter desulfuricans (strain DSM 14783 / JCM 11476 / NBRC 101012 / SSM1) TaxID=639282 RepID=D3PDS4_DEFDS|nr:manganese efflux pump MntP family protein [Deferribacter desulfuricans]BAI80747.1 conserved hypothetical protein [Deferribacter desulfuricans SSM1]
MNYIEVFAIAFALSMDAFSVSFGVGCKFNTLRHYFRLAFHFGLFQFMMPLIGAYIGTVLKNYVAGLNYFAAVILFFIGYKMVKDGIKDEGDHCYASDPTRGFSLVYLSIATSLDALGVGLTLAVGNNNIFLSSLIIGIVCAVFSIFGVYFGSLSRKFFGDKMEILGGVVLIIIGIKFLVV